MMIDEYTGLTDDNSEVRGLKEAGWPSSRPPESATTPRKCCPANDPKHGFIIDLRDN